MIPNTTRINRRAAGVCIACGKVPTEPGRRCPPCRAVLGEVFRRMRDARRAAGLCWRCGVAPQAGPGTCAECRAVRALKVRARRAAA